MLRDRWHWLIGALVCPALFLGWIVQFPEEARGFLEDPPGLAPYWLLFSLASFVLIVYLERAVRREATPAFRGWKSVVVAIALSALSVQLEARAASGLFVGFIYVVAAVLHRSLQVPLKRWPDRLAQIENIRAIFFLSGCSALLYQVIWQWRLMAFVGANSEAVAIIVAVFMAGLGIGGYLGGRLAIRLAGRGLALFFGIEVGIGICGLVSLPLLDFVATQSASVPQGSALIALVAALLMPPTILMGATLPVLVELMRPSVPAMNENVGKLYAVNAYGSAAAALIAVMVLFPFVGQTAATCLAATLNVAAAVLVWHASRGWTSRGSTTFPSSPAAADKPRQSLGYSALIVLAFVTGFVTIGQEVVLLRQANWLGAGRAEIFGIGVGSFLLGLASGSWKQTLIGSDRLTREALGNWLALAVVAAAAPFVAAQLSGLSASAGFLAIMATLFACGFLGARSLPMIAGLLRASDQQRFGAIYFSNVLGSVGGSLVLGYWLADLFDLASLVTLTALLTLIVAAAFLVADRLQGTATPRGRLLILGACATALLFLAPVLSDRWLERMLLQEINPAPFAFVAQGKSGIVAVNDEGSRKVVYGGGIYDGAISYRRSPDLNLIGRLYRALSLHDDPAQVLEIGLSSGSWARGILLDGRVRSLTTVEINPAYERLVASFDEVRPVLADARFALVPDDGRRWLRAHSDKRFDVIVSNTTYHWRSGITLITSREFMRIVKAHLNPGGMFVINTTYSENVAATTCEAFAHCVQIGNMIAASDTAFDLSAAAARRRLSKHSEFASMSNSSFDSWLRAWPALSVADKLKSAKIITDDRMTDEFRRR